MTLEELKKKWLESYNNSNGTIIDFSLNQDYEANICFELGQYSGGDFGGRPCLKSEKINLKKGNKFQTAVIFIANDVSPEGINRGVSINDSYVTMRYKDKQFQIPMSKINIIDAKSVPQSELKSFSGDIVTTNEIQIAPSKYTSSQEKQSTKTAEDEFYEKLGIKYNPTWNSSRNKGRALILIIAIGGYFAYKKFKK